MLCDVAATIQVEEKVTMHSNINKIGNDDAQLRMDKKYKTDIWEIDHRLWNRVEDLSKYKNRQIVAVNLKLATKNVFSVMVHMIILEWLRFIKNT